MPQPSFRFFTLIALLAALAGGVNAASRLPAASTLLQAPVSDEGLALLAGGSRAEVVAGDRSGRSLRLRRGERLEAVAEIQGGFLAAGVRESDDGSELLILEQALSGSGRIPAPPRTEALQLRPVLLVEEGTLVGAAWLEGPNPTSLRVKAADWDGSGWGPVESVGRTSAGSQTGLAGTVMRSGDGLLVWSQFDGRDDEIFFSVREDSSWARPERAFANNQQPDIAPSVIFTRAGAVMAWSRFDGSDYRLWTARFERGSWRDAREVGPPGSLFPELLRRKDGVFALIRNAAPRGWSVTRLSETGPETSGAFFATAESERPLLVEAGSSKVTLAWPQTGRMIEGRLERTP